MSLKDRTAADASDINAKFGWAVTQTKKDVGSRLAKGGFTRQKWGFRQRRGIKAAKTTFNQKRGLRQ